MDYYKDTFSKRPYLKDLCPKRLNKPAYVIDMAALERNLQILSSVQERSGAKILLALKGFATTATFPLIKKYLYGCCASSPYEARLAREEFGGEVHSFAPAYSEDDLQQQLFEQEQQRVAMENQVRAQMHATGDESQVTGQPAAAQPAQTTQPGGASAPPPQNPFLQGQGWTNAAPDPQSFLYQKGLANLQQNTNSYQQTQRNQQQQADAWQVNQIGQQFGQGA